MSYQVAKPINFVIVSVALSVGLLSALPAAAATFNASDFNSLANNISNANAQGGDNTINITNDITLSGALPQISSNIIFNGGAKTVSGNGNQDFFVNSGTVSFNNLTIANGLAQGGNGENGLGGGGGGAGLGGGLFIKSGTVAVNGVNFSGSQALGGGGYISYRGGNGGGYGGYGGGGGGGAGLGGAIFVNSGSTLTLSDTTFTGNSATGGSGGSNGDGSFAANGQGKGGAIFIAEGANATSVGQPIFRDNTARDADNSPTDNNNVYGELNITNPPPVPVPAPSSTWGLLTLVAGIGASGLQHQLKKRSL